jgi:hypothetical protein
VMRCYQCGRVTALSPGRRWPQYLWLTPKGPVGLCGPKCSADFDAETPRTAERPVPQRVGQGVGK